MPDWDAMLAVLTEQHDRYCPRCDAVTKWTNLCRDGIHRSFGCFECDLVEAGLMTEEECERYATHSQGTDG